MIDLIAHISQSPEALVGLSAFLATFIASVMADEQNDRLRQGTFGAIAGTSVGGLAAVFEKEPNLLLIGIFGSACGAVVGWVIYLGLSLLPHFRWGRRLIEYQVLTNQTNSPCAMIMPEANKQGENRDKPTYQSFLVFRLNDDAVLSLDWPGNFAEQDPYVNVARALVHLDVGPAIGKLLNH